ncbi:unnamed protein product [Macrosiphum euphorbiae]|uniref:Uncharacterized protein n=1 Tax=Macrosiphum euphorbiae TaxID=13131 RepID=A0AAV0XPB2_9HEMI|nr:unnamed protein product [Macrosiphum euphorbiae]
MDAFGGSPASRLNKVIADMGEKYEKELALHVDLIEINDSKITTFGEKFTKELAIHSNISEGNEKKISTLGDGARVIEMKIMRIESTVDKYFSDTNNKIESLIESIEIVNKNNKDLKTNLARIVILEDRIDGYQYSSKLSASKTF